MPPFPTPYPTLLSDDPQLGTALATAIAEAQVSFPSLGTPPRIAISMAAIDDTVSPPDFKHAGLNFAETHYSASLLKVGALYAAYELRRSANALAASSAPATPAELFAQLHAQFDPQIDNAVPLISQTPGVTSAMRLPKYEQIFATVPLVAGGFSVVFGGQFSTTLRNMIVASSNDAAAACIQALGYSWVNGALQAGGYFFPPTQSGIWLAGTFTGSLPYVRIPSVNDGPVAQATTCFDMANLYAHMFQKSLVDMASSDEMLTMLADAALTGPDPSFIDWTRRGGFPARSFKVTHTKIGLGPLKTGQMVASEGTLVQHQGSGRKFLTVWQNSFNDGASLTGIAQIVERTIELFLTGP